MASSSRAPSAPGSRVRTSFVLERIKYPSPIIHINTHTHKKIGRREPILALSLEPDDPRINFALMGHDAKLSGKVHFPILFLPWSIVHIYMIRV